MDYELNDKEQIIYDLLDGSKWDDKSEPIRISVIIATIYDVLSSKDFGKAFAGEKRDPQHNIQVIADTFYSLHCFDEENSFTYAETVYCKINDYLTNKYYEDMKKHRNI